MPNRERGGLLLQRDVLVAAVMFAAAAVVKCGAAGIRAAESRVMPEVLFWLMSVCAGVLLVKTIIKKEYTGDVSRVGFSSKELAGILCMAACWLLMRILGFYTSICLMMTALMLLMEPEKAMSVRTLLRSFLWGIAVTVVIFAVFRYLFHMITPAGLWV